MKKFVSMETINKVFDDMHQIDYIVVDNVTDSAVDLVIYLKTVKQPLPGSPDYTRFNDHCLVLGKMLDRKINIIFISAKWTANFWYKLTKIFRST